MQLLLLLLAIPVSASANYFKDKTLYGAAIIKQTAAYESSIAGKKSDNGSGFGLYLERYYDLTYRLNATLSYLNYSDFNVTGLTGSADYYIPVIPDTSLFVGAALGGAVQKYNDGSFNSSAVGLVYGVQLGAIQYINENYLIELGYRLRLTDLTTSDPLVSNVKTSINELNEFYFSVLYMF